MENSQSGLHGGQAEKRVLAAMGQRNSGWCDVKDALRRAAPVLDIAPTTEGALNDGGRNLQNDLTF